MRPALVRVARVELTRMRRSGALAALAVVLGGLIVASGLVAWRAERAYEAQRQRYSATVDAQWDQQPDRHPHRVSLPVSRPIPARHSSSRRTGRTR
jgi:ABC-2 type transport system permease protein